MTARGRVPYCPVCMESLRIDRLPAEQREKATHALFDRLDRIKRHHTAYGRRRR